jgi:hypothetical protein
MTLISGLVISPVSRRNLVRGPVIAAAVACLIGSAAATHLRLRRLDRVIGHHLISVLDRTLPGKTGS